MKKNVYLAAALIGMGGFVWTGCSDDEKIVEKEVEKIVIEQDITKLSDAVREGLRGNPKMVTEFSSYAATEGENGVVSPGEWYEKTVMYFNEGGYQTKMEYYTISYTALEKDMPDDPNDTWYKLANPELRQKSTITVTLGANNRPSGILEEEGVFAYFVVNTEGESTMIYMSSADPFDMLDFGIENPKSLIVKQTSATKIVTTIDLIAKKATSITQVQGDDITTWTDIQKEVADLDEFGYPNENSKEVFKTRAFEDQASVKYVEKLDAKGNWIIRYSFSDNARSYTKRDIVYY